MAAIARPRNRKPRTNMAAASAAGGSRYRACSRRPAPRWLLRLFARRPRGGSWWACSLSAPHWHGCRPHKTGSNSRLPVVAGRRSFLFWKLSGAGERCGVNGERELRASAPAPNGEDG
ncbi:hypothetical protein NN561_002570 [Cricetulus griseus]